MRTGRYKIYFKFPLLNCYFAHDEDLDRYVLLKKFYNESWYTFAFKEICQLF